MDASRNPEYLNGLAAAVEDFKDKLDLFVRLHLFNDEPGRGSVPALFPRRDLPPGVIRQAAAQVSRAAGRAADAPYVTNVYFRTERVGTIDPIAMWHSIAEADYLMEAANVFDLCEQMIGRLEGMSMKAASEAPPTIGVSAMHPLIWGAAGALWRDQHYREAVASAAQALIDNVKNRTGRRDVQDTGVWQETFSVKAPEPGRPRLRWPGDPSDKSVISMMEGLRSYAPGVQLTIRNGSTHSSSQISEQDGLERLAALSLLARWVDDCDLITVETP